MRTIKKRILKPFLFACLGLTVATITFASVMRIFDRPDPPGRPSAFDIEEEWAELRFKKPKGDGGALIEFYRVQYINVKEGHWLPERTVGPQYSVYDVIQCRVDNRVGKDPASFRAIAVNKAGESVPSKPSDPITFRNPF